MCCPGPGEHRAPGWGSPTSPSRQGADCGVSTLAHAPHKRDSPKRPPCCSRQTPGPSSAFSDGPVGLVCGPLDSPPTLCILLQHHGWPRTGARVFMGSSVAPGQGLQGSGRLHWEGSGVRGTRVRILTVTSQLSGLRGKCHASLCLSLLICKMAPMGLPCRSAGKDREATDVVETAPHHCRLPERGARQPWRAHGLRAAGPEGRPTHQTRQ